MSSHIFIATPCYGGQLTMAYVKSVLDFQAEAAKRGIRTSFRFVANEALIVRARNELTWAFLQSDATHLLFIDADIGFEPQAPFRLFEFNREVSAAAYPLKHIDWQKVRRAVEAQRPNVASSSLDFAVRRMEDTRILVRGDGFAQVRHAATGFLMLKRSAVERVCAAHPELKYKAIERTTDIGRTDLDRVSIFECMIDPSTGEYLSEDYAFCRRWLDLGGEIWLDTQSELTVRISWSVFGSIWLTWIYAVRLAVRPRGLAAQILSPRRPRQSRTPGWRPTRFRLLPSRRQLAALTDTQNAIMIGTFRFVGREINDMGMR